MDHEISKIHIIMPTNERIFAIFHPQIFFIHDHIEPGIN